MWFWCKVLKVVSDPMMKAFKVCAQVVIAEMFRQGVKAGRDHGPVWGWIFHPERPQFISGGFENAVYFGA